MSDENKPTAYDIAAELSKTMQCNCDLDNWEPERSTGHSCVCRIHKFAVERFRNPPRAALKGGNNV